MKPQITSVFITARQKCLSRLALAAGLILPVPLMQAGPPDHAHRPPCLPNSSRLSATQPGSTRTVKRRHRGRLRTLPLAAVSGP